MWNVNSPNFFTRNGFLPIETLPCKRVNNNIRLSVGEIELVVDRKQEIVIICFSFVLSFMDAGHWDNIYLLAVINLLCFT